jgi:anti-anti-sigma factor
MTDVRYPIEMVNGVPVVAAPAEIDISNADWLDAVLREAAARGQAMLVVDMTGTAFCASAGVGVLVRAHKRALAQGGELRLVIPTSAAVLRKLAVTGIDRVIPTFSSLYEALEAPAATAPRPRLPAPGRGSGERRRRGRPPRSRSSCWASRMAVAPLTHGTG